MAQLNIYADCTSDKPSKVYECKRLLTGFTLKVYEVADELKGKKQPIDQYKRLIAFVRELFPQMTEEEAACIDTSELMPFFRELMAMPSGTMAKAQKN